MTRFIGSSGSRRRRRSLTGLIACTLLLAVITAPSAVAVHDLGLMELDKNATNDLTTVKVAILNSNTSATATTLSVCRVVASNPATPFTILIDAEQMTVTAIAPAGGGGCPSGTQKQTWTVTRHVNGSTAASHAGGSNITQMITGPVDGADWDQVFADAPDCSGINATVCSFINDPAGDSIFTTGGSKDDLDVPNWRHTDGSVPDADEINDAMAAKFESGGDQILYFAADRFAVNGAKDFGFWFFHNNVAPLDDGTFSGTHNADPGDVLILGTFTNGGATTTIRVFKWVGSGGSDGPLDLVGSLGDCSSALSGDFGCATVNNTTVPSPWPYQGKSSPAANTFLSGAFVEGGINLTALEIQGCFSNFLAETRSSPELGAQLKDFVHGTFEACESELTTTPADGNGDPLTGDLSIGTGSVQARDTALLNVTGTDTFSGTLSFHICGPIAADALCDTGGVAAGSQTVTANGTYTSDPVTLTSVGRYCWRGDFDSDTEGVDDDSDSSETECFNVAPVTPTLTTQAGEDVVLGNPITDTASLTGTAKQPGDDGGSNPGQPDNTYPTINATNGAPAGGEITFTVVGPDSCDPSGLTVTGSPVAVSGDNPSYGPVSALPTAIGEYTFIATYSGSSPNTNAAGPTLCSDANEKVIVSGSASLSTAQRWLPNDTAHITSQAGTTLAGDVTFTLYNDGTCGADLGTSQYSVTRDVVADALPGGTANDRFVSTANTDFVVTVANDATAYSWLVHYNDDALADPTDTCESTTAFTLTDEA
jgi:hypothetical protein